MDEKKARDFCRQMNIPYTRCESLSVSPRAEKPRCKRVGCTAIVEHVVCGTASLSGYCSMGCYRFKDKARSYKG